MKTIDNFSRKLYPHINGYHGSSKDACIYCCKDDANERQTCEIRTEREYQSHFKKVLEHKRLMKVLSGLSRSDRTIVERFINRDDLRVPQQE